MNKFLALTLLIGIALVGCASPTSLSDSHTSDLVVKNDKVHIFYHYVDPKFPYEPAALLTGKFEIENNCLYWVSYGGKKSTPLFPNYPKGAVKLDTKRKTITYGDHRIKIGKRFAVNGGIVRYRAGSRGGKYYEEQGHVECLTPNLAIIGTSFSSVKDIEWLDE